jgi:hypothetical protein
VCSSSPEPDEGSESEELLSVLRQQLEDRKRGGDVEPRSPAEEGLEGTEGNQAVQSSLVDIIRLQVMR